MRLWKSLRSACVVICLAIPVLAQEDINFVNSDGMFTGTGVGLGNTLSLGSLSGTGDSTLIQISGFTGPLSGYDTTGANLGTVYFATGALTSGSMIPLTGQTSTFGAGGAFDVTDTFNGGDGGFTFDGMFTKEHWLCVGTCKLVKGTTNQYSGTWQFNGKIGSAQLTIDGQTINITSAVDFQGTVNNGIIKVHQNGTVTVADTGGTTNFSISPEPGTLTLFGSGLIAVGLLTKYGRSRRLTDPKQTAARDF